MSLFRLDASIRREGSVTRQVADTVEAAWHAEHPGGAVNRRDLGTEPLPADAWLTAVSAGMSPAEQRSGAQLEATRLATTLADELIAADAYLFAVPLYNFGVPHHVKAWIDLLLTDPRLGPGGDQPLAGRPAVLVLARGGGYGPGTPREGWDHATPYLRRIFGDVLGLDLHVTAAELTLAGVNPAMAELRGLAEQSLNDAHGTAETHGRSIGKRVRDAA
ncbi:FMN-dependent NADH-azoreductase [Micromonospora pattaloongensis]|uniref:FMN dependent NADH:quinone oxidoreductase n=1 Tax=Micromonospora pattaloongensis TaxID=405436 RepID=A0A1H3N2D2_9ACTN|nr:NAD(P)H-dependent oxidoreductase [Micromonospora pattaloongensis]SDY82399.1 FMN-dependent NADH-azoreductase [Micromonospora pattaloongensis]